MTIRTSIYDFFAYTIPGGLLIFAILGGLETFGFTDLWSKLLKANFSDLLITIICSYIIGHITSAVSSKWVKLFEPRTLSILAFKEFKDRHPKIEIDIEPNDWQIWFASIRRESLELTLEVDRLMATSYFLRGLSFSLALSCLILFSGIIFGKLISLWSILCIISAISSFITVKQSIKFNKWFYFLIFELVISRREPYYFEKQKQKKDN